MSDDTATPESMTPEVPPMTFEELLAVVRELREKVERLERDLKDHRRKHLELVRA